MASYGLKYKADFRNIRKQDYRIYIYQRDYTGSSKTIGGLSGCSLEIQGAQGKIIDPIVKTQLRFSVVDAWDKPDTSSVKYGDWQEFFTPDSTLYKVVLYSLSGSTATAIWTGYITPDSWHEDLDYHGIITVTARDNIGHLKDFPFVADGSITPDGYGLITMSDIIDKALDAVEFPMDIVWGTSIPFGDGVHLVTNARLNASLFDGMDWYEVLEQTLEAVGYVFRYVGQNKFTICSLRDMPEMGHYYETTGEQTMEFYGGSLELDPAVKQIREEADFKREAELKEDPKAGMLIRGNKREYTWQIRNQTGQAWDYQNVNIGGYGWLTGYGFLKGDAYSLTTTLRENEGDDAATAWPVLIANQQTPTTFQTYKLPLVSPNVVLHMVFGIPLEGKGLSMQILRLGVLKGYLQRLALRVMFVAGGNTLYWNGSEWVSNSYVLEYTPADSISTEYKVDIPLGEADRGDNSYLLIEFQDIRFDGGDMPDQGVYARIKSITTEFAGALLEKNTVTTINNPVYNVKLDRRPLFSALSKTMGFAQPRNYGTGMFFYEYVGAAPILFPYNANFDEDDPLVPLPVLVHMQILCYYYGAARVLSGNCAPINKAKFDFGKLCNYKGISYLLQGGTIDLFSGIISGAVLREFVTFSSLWSDDPPEYSEDVIYNN